MFPRAVPKSLRDAVDTRWMGNGSARQVFPKALEAWCQCQIAAWQQSIESSLVKPVVDPHVHQLTETGHSGASFGLPYGFPYKKMSHDRHFLTLHFPEQLRTAEVDSTGVPA